MTIRILSAAMAMTVLSACSQGQKGRTPLKTEMDSVSYAIGADIGNNFKRSKLDSVNLDAMREGMRDGLDSTVKMDEMTMQTVVQNYMMRLQEKRQAQEREEGEANRVVGEEYLMENAKRPGVTTTGTGLQYEVITMGTGPKPTATDRVKVHYVGTLINGEEFDGSVKRGEPVVFGVTQVIPGWVEALQLMPTGSKWKLHIPSDLAYGPSRGPGGDLPPHSVLIFEIELIEIVE